MKKGKKLGGKPPRQTGKWARRPQRSSRPSRSYELILTIAAGLLVFGAVAGFAVAMDREVRGGIIRQQAEAAARPDWVPLQELPAYLPRAFVAVVDPEFLAEGALVSGDRRTTFSRDLVRQVHLLSGGLRDEARQLVMAPVLEQRTSKRELLELYLNRVHLGEERGFPIYGVYHAATEYFGKEPSELTLGESATLAGLLLNPRISDPNDRAGAVGARRNEVLRVMLQANLITAEQFQSALQEPLGFQPGVRDLPMTRPQDYGHDEDVIRLPPELVPRPDTTAAD